MDSPRQPRIHKGEIEALLDRLCNVPEELLSIERSLERIQATKPNNREDGSGRAARTTR
jgi:hypothetical protein